MKLLLILLTVFTFSCKKNNKAYVLNEDYIRETKSDAYNIDKITVGKDTFYVFYIKTAAGSAIHAIKVSKTPE